MPNTASGIYYPDPNFAPQIIEDITAQAANVSRLLDDRALFFAAGPETITAPVAYTPSVGAGVGDRVTVNTALTPTGTKESLVALHYLAQIRRSVTTATTSVAIFITPQSSGVPTQLKSPVANAIPAIQEGSDSAVYGTVTNYGLVRTRSQGIDMQAAGAATDTQFTYNLGVIFPAPVVIWGMPPDTYFIDIRFKQTTGNIILGKRVLMAETFKSF